MSAQRSIRVAAAVAVALVGLATLGLIGTSVVLFVEEGEVLTAAVAVCPFAAVAWLTTLITRALLRSGPDAPASGLVRWLGPVMVVLVVLGILVMFSGADWTIGYLPLALAAAWLATLAVLGIHEQRSWLAALVLCSIVAGVMGLVGVTSTVRMHASEDQIVAAGREVLAGGEPEQAGTYGILSSRIDRGCAVMVTQTMVFDEYGVAYCPAAHDSGVMSHVVGDVYQYEWTD